MRNEIQKGNHTYNKATVTIWRLNGGELCILVAERTNKNRMI